MNLCSLGLDLCRLADFLRIRCFFFFKQKTAYEMRISDWSSDVCSSDLNIVDGAVVHPDHVVCGDNDDPYFVVAADKGTASFSDIANGIALERGFWLGDAFASGGSNGYAHKAMGITARGAWISVHRNFAEIGVDVQTGPVNVR